ncbi:MAG: glycosyltransferase [Thermoplasmatales archaeon]
MTKTAVLLEEFSRIGGGQNVAKHIMRSLSDKYDFDIVADRYHPVMDGFSFNKIVETRYEYYEGISFIKLLLGIKKLSKDLKDLDRYIASHDLSINNHPNIFLYNATINILHESFLRYNLTKNVFLDSFVNRLIKASKVYSIYSDARMVLPGNYLKKEIADQCKYLGINPVLNVINYPVDYPSDTNFDLKKKFAIIFGRINPDKKLETVFDIAKNSKNRFVIAGSVNKGSEWYLNKLILNKPHNVEIIINPDEETKNQLLTQATVYLHTKNFESYGLSVAEGLSYGCIPVVPKNGGPWVDIVKSGSYGFGYLDPQEASEIIDNVINDNISNYRYVYASRDRFSFDRFRSSFLDLVQKSLSLQ